MNVDYHLSRTRESSLLARVGRQQWLLVLRRAARTRRGMFGLIIMLFIALIAALGPLFAPHSSTSFVTSSFSAPSAAYPFGGDDLGRDVLSRVLDGGWVLLLMAIGATAFGVIFGAAVGVSAAYLRGRIDGVLMRAVDIILAFPQLVFALLLVSIIGPKLWLIVLAVGFSHIPAVARVLRSASLDVSERDYVKYAEMQGFSRVGVMFKEILPNLISPLMVETGLRLTYSIVVMAGLEFLGFGQPPPAPNWGSMISENQIGLSANPWAVIVPALLIALLTIGTNTYTDAVARVALGVERKPEEAVLLENVAVGESTGSL
ncbi:MAG: ABC transporter permease [Actinomycetota bacterium]|nr:ABC transporter permease [Actinomycetota bacterium]